MASTSELPYHAISCSHACHELKELKYIVILTGKICLCQGKVIKISSFVCSTIVTMHSFPHWAQQIKALALPPVHPILNHSIAVLAIAINLNRGYRFPSSKTLHLCFQGFHVSCTWGPRWCPRHPDWKGSVMWDLICTFAQQSDKTKSALIGKEQNGFLWHFCTFCHGIFKLS